MKGMRGCYLCHGSGHSPFAADDRCKHVPGPVDEAVFITKIEAVKRLRGVESRSHHPSQEYPESHG